MYIFVSLPAALLVGSGFLCLRGFDLRGDPAGTGDPENPGPVANTELVGMTPSLCATACKSTVGCQYIVMKKPAVPGGTATCYLKMHALGGLYGTTGPATDVDLTCFNGQDAWMTFGGQLDYALPSPEVNTGIATPAIAPIGVNGTAAGKTYHCIKQYSIQGSIITRHNVSTVSRACYDIWCCQLLKEPACQPAAGCAKGLLACDVIPSMSSMFHTACPQCCCATAAFLAHTLPQAK